MCCVLVAFPCTCLTAPACRTTSNAGGYGSGRNSYAGSLVDPLNGSMPGSGRSSYAGMFPKFLQGDASLAAAGRVAEVPRKRCIACCQLLKVLGNTNGCDIGQAGWQWRSSGQHSVLAVLGCTAGSGYLADGVYQRGGAGGYSMPGSHPLTSFSSNASSLAGMGSLGGSGGQTLQHAGSLGGVNGASVPGGSYGGAGSYPGSQGGSPKAAYGSLGGFGPAGSGPLYKSGSLTSLGAGAPGSRGASSAGGGVAAGGYPSEAGAGSRGPASTGGTLGGFNSAPLVGVAGGCSWLGLHRCLRHTDAAFMFRTGQGCYAGVRDNMPVQQSAVDAAVFCGGQPGALVMLDVKLSSMPATTWCCGDGWGQPGRADVV